uniref:Storkhead box 1 n=1 Tax=Zosterops lateralis melanops TaxID=1220523 RepID=A0A8D2P8U1_ZOSLA
MVLTCKQSFKKNQQSSELILSLSYVFINLNDGFSWNFIPNKLTCLRQPSVSFITKALDKYDVTPGVMNGLWQSRPVPLAEGICRTISGMNAARVMVTQQTLMERLVNNYPGIAVPSHNTLYNILGTLIKERKIYHTGEGYFIMTPNKYFITNDAREDSRRILLEDSCCCSSPSITYLVNIKPYADLVKESIPTASCYRSCHCSPDQNTLCEQKHWQVMSHESNGDGKRGCSELKPSTRTQGISTSAENHSWDAIKSLTSVKQISRSSRKS